MSTATETSASASPKPDTVATSTGITSDSGYARNARATRASRRLPAAPATSEKLAESTTAAPGPSNGPRERKLGPTPQWDRTPFWERWRSLESQEKEITKHHPDAITVMWPAYVSRAGKQMHRWAAFTRPPESRILEVRTAMTLTQHGRNRWYVARGLEDGVRPDETDMARSLGVPLATEDPLAALYE